MDNNREDTRMNAEIEMIKELRKKIYGDCDAGPKYPFSDNHCIFCGSESELQEYKNSYICSNCLSDIKG